MATLISEKSVKVLDALENIESLNEMLRIHQDDDFMLQQYNYRKEGYLKLLQEYLQAFEINLSDLAA